ncbi:MAG: hypothetical protein NTV07_05280 [Candidatus Omnitrophica bacterium]|nr:hypothetical protein [Candidatus Omnitrophota bacterium]
MAKKYGVFYAAAIVMVCFCGATAFAADGSCSSPEAKLKDVQARKEQTAKEYRAAVDQAASETNAKINQLKADYKKACRECAKARDAQCEKLRADYDAKMQPLSAEEKQIISTMVPSQRMNFAKPKYEREEKK